jgi:C1A family cysteine protease
MQAKTVLTIAAIVAVVSILQLAYIYSASSKQVQLYTTQEFQAYNQFKAEFGRKYGASEDQVRFRVFSENFNKINSHQNNTNRTFNMSVNQFADLTSQEFTAFYLTVKVNQTGNATFLNATTVDSVDWRTSGKVSPVKNQASCGSCWAFSATGAMESAAAIKTGVLPLLSEQQLVDCSRKYGNQGCNGGWMAQAFKYTVENGLASEAQYPYKAVDQTCKNVTGTFRLKGSANVPAGNVAQLAAAAAIQPVSIAVDASNWQFYKNGVFSNCGTGLNHGVLLVGYTPEHWIVKNSWAEKWGESGYIRLTRGNTCGLANVASYPIA